MGSNLLVNYESVVAIILFGIGLTNLLVQKNLIKKIIGLNIMDTAVYLLLATQGYIKGRMAPIIVNGNTDPTLYINPVPSGIPLGNAGNIISSGLILPLNICVGLVVACTMYAFYTLFKKGGM